MLTTLPGPCLTRPRNRIATPTWAWMRFSVQAGVGPHQSCRAATAVLGRTTSTNRWTNLLLMIFVNHRVSQCLRTVGILELRHLVPSRKGAFMDPISGGDHRCSHGQDSLKALGMLPRRP